MSAYPPESGHRSGAVIGSGCNHKQKFHTGEVWSPDKQALAAQSPNFCRAGSDSGILFRSVNRMAAPPRLGHIYKFLFRLITKQNLCSNA